jgi:hypothetical protein
VSARPGIALVVFVDANADGSHFEDPATVAALFFDTTVEPQRQEATKSSSIVKQGAASLSASLFFVDG